MIPRYLPGGRRKAWGLQYLPGVLSSWLLQPPSVGDLQFCLSCVQSEHASRGPVLRAKGLRLRENTSFVVVSWGRAHP